MNRNVSKADYRAIQIVKLQEELAEARAIISNFVWPPEYEKKHRQAFMVMAARFAGVSVPHFADNETAEEREKSRYIDDRGNALSAADVELPIRGEMV